MLKLLEVLTASHLVRAHWSDATPSLHRLGFEPGQTQPYEWRDGSIHFYAHTMEEVRDFLTIAYDVPVEVKELSPEMEAFGKTLT